EVLPAPGGPKIVSEDLLLAADNRSSALTMRTGIRNSSSGSRLCCRRSCKRRGVDRAPKDCLSALAKRTTPPLFVVPAGRASRGCLGFGFVLSLDAVDRPSCLDGSRGDEELAHGARPIGEGCFRDFELGLDVFGRIVTPAGTNDLGGVLELVLIPFDPLGEVGDDDEAIVLEANHPCVLALLGPALTSARAVLEIEGASNLVLDARDTRFLLAEIVEDAGELRRRERSNRFRIKVAHVLGHDSNVGHAGPSQAASAVTVAGSACAAIASGRARGNGAACRQCPMRPGRAFTAK